MASYSGKTQILNDENYDLSSKITFSLQINICHNGAAKIISEVLGYGKYPIFFVDAKSNALN